jgi:tetratricopeptide (TPR) repeat protein
MAGFERHWGQEKMSTRTARYCERIIEAGWLAAAILTPLFFNIYSSRVFEPDKLTLLRSIASLMAVAWLIRTLEQIGSRGGASPESGEQERPPAAALWHSLTMTPLVPQVLLLVLVYLLATAASVVPRTSSWGSYQRLQGTYTFLAYVTIFFTAWQTLRTRGQLERLLNVIVLASLPVALYGVLQRHGLDPLPWAGSVRERVTANLGNAIFISAYLIMPFFITLERVVARFRRLLGEEGGTLADAFAGGTYLFILAVQALAIYYSKSRGPWLGLLAGAYVFVLISLVALRRGAGDDRPLGLIEAVKALLLALLSPLVGVVPAYLALIVKKRGSRWLWLSWCIQSLLAIAFLLVLNLSHSPLAALRGVPGIGRLGQVFETESGTGRVRVLIWEGAAEMLMADPARALIGYGPESMYVAFNPHYPPELAHLEARSASPDRSHNETFDALVTTGIAGFLVYFALFVGIFYYGLRWLGVLPGGKGGTGPRRRSIFLAFAIGGALLGALLPLAVDRSLRFAGVGIPAGLIAGVAIYLAVSAFARAGASEMTTIFGARELLLVGLLAMIVAHFVEIHFGIAIAATRLYFWLGLAVLLAAGSGRLSLEPTPGPAAPAVLAPAPPPTRRKRSKRRRATARAPVVAPERPAVPLSGAVVAGLIGALILGTLFYCFATNPGGDRNPFEIIVLALTSIALPDQEAIPSPGIAAMVLLTWVLGVILVVAEAENAAHTPDGRWWFWALGWYLAISLGGGLCFGLVHAWRLQAPMDLGQIIVYYYAFALGIILLAAAFLPGQRLAGGRLWQSWAWSYPLLLAGAGVLIVGNLTIVRADIYYKQAWDGLHRPASEALSSGRMDRALAGRYYDAALAHYDKAIQYAPSEDYYLLFRGKAYLELLSLADQPEVQLLCLTRSEQDLERARQLNPLNTDHTANLARLHRSWAASVQDDTTRRQRLAQAAHFFEEATRLSPHNAVLYNEWGRTLLDLGQTEEALATYQRSLALDDRFAQTHVLLGDYYASQGEVDLAIASYRKALELNPGLLHARSVLGQLYSKKGWYVEAISENLRVLQLVPQDYVSRKNLAILYGEIGQLKEALAAATTARQLAPEGEQAALDQLISELQGALGQEGKP